MHRDPDQEWLPCQYRLNKKTIEQIICEWPQEWIIHVANEEIVEEEIDKELMKEALEKSNAEKKPQLENNQ